MKLLFFFGFVLFCFIFLFFSPFPPLLPCTHFWWCFLYIPHFDQFGHLYLFLPTHIFLSHLASYTFCHTQFFTPFSTSVPFFSVMLISFILSYPTCFPFQFFPVHLAVRICHCLLYLLICPLWRKAWLFDTLGCNFFPLFFPLFPPLDVESLSLAFYLFTLFLWLHCIFWSILWSPCWTVGVDFFAFTFYFLFIFVCVCVCAFFVLFF